MDNLEPTRFVFTDADIASFFDEHEKAKAKDEADQRAFENRVIETAVSEEMAHSFEDIGYVFPDEGTTRYEAIRDSFRAMVEDELNLQFHETEQKRATMREFKLDSKTTAVADSERSILEQTANLLKDYLIRIEAGLTTHDAAYIDAQKRAIAAAGVVRMLLPQNNPALSVLNHVIPPTGSIDFSSPDMMEYYKDAIDKLADGGADEQKLNEFHGGLLEIIGTFDMTNDGDFDRIIAIKDMLVEQVTGILGSNSTTEEEKTSYFQDLIATCGLEKDEASQIIDYIIEHYELLH